MSCNIYLNEEYRGMALLCTAAEIETLITQHHTTDVDKTNNPSKSITVSKNTPATSVRVKKNVNSTMIEIDFEKGMYASMVVNKRVNGKGSNLFVYVPFQLTGGRKRYIHFTPRYGSGELFRDFVVDEIKTIASSWKSPSDPSRWCKSSLDIWKHRVETEWRFELLKMRSKLVEYENVSPHPTKCDFTINIPLYNLLLGREVQSIRIRRARNTKNGRPYLLITFPGAIFADNKMRRKSMKSRFGRDSQWASFIEGFLKGAVYQWKTIEDARVWYVKSGFVHQVNRLWEIKLKKNFSQRGSVVVDRT